MRTRHRQNDSIVFCVLILQEIKPDNFAAFKIIALGLMLVSQAKMALLF